MKNIFTGACALLVTTFLCSQALANNSGDLASQPKFKAAEAMFAGKPKESCDILASSYDLNNVGDTDVLYLRGQCLQALGRHAESIPVYERILSINPNANIVRPHLANALKLSGRDDESRLELEKILRANPPEALAASIRNALASDSAQKPWYLETEAGLIYDSNISAGPDSTQITAFGLPFTLGTASREQDSAGHELSLSGGYRFGITNDLAILAQASYAETNYFENDTFDSQNVGVSLGPVYRYGKWNFNPNATASWRSLDGDTFARTFGGNARASYQLTNDVLLNATVGTVENEYSGKSRDGHSDFGTVGVNYKATDNALLYAGYFLGRDKTKDDRFENVKHGPNAGAVVRVGSDITTRLNLSYSDADYEGKDVAFANKERNDDIYNAGARISYDIGQHVNVGNLGLNFDLSHTRAKSNIEIYDYDRQTAKVSISKSW